MVLNFWLHAIYHMILAYMKWRHDASCYITRVSFEAASSQLRNICHHWPYTLVDQLAFSLRHIAHLSTLYYISQSNHYCMCSPHVSHHTAGQSTGSPRCMSSSLRPKEGHKNRSIDCPSLRITKSFQKHNTAETLFRIITAVPGNCYLPARRMQAQQMEPERTRYIYLVFRSIDFQGCPQESRPQAPSLCSVRRFEILQTELHRPGILAKTFA